MAPFLSTVTNRIDRKGRVSIPAPYRAALTTPDFAGVVVFPHFGEPCLRGLSYPHLLNMAAGLDSQHELFSSEYDAFATAIFSECRTLEWDAEGRIVLPTDFLEHAGLSEEACFVGKSGWFEIWDPTAYAPIRASARALAKSKPLTVKLNGLVPVKGGGPS